MPSGMTPEEQPRPDGRLKRNHEGRPGVPNAEDPPTASREDGSWSPGCSQGRGRGGRVSPALSAEHSHVHTHPWLLERPSKPGE